MGAVKRDNSQAARLARVEAQLAIGQLPIRYALAVDQRDLDAWVGLFVPDVDMGRHGRGREVLREWIAPAVSQFYRSIHQICGHRIELGPAGPTGEPETASGQVYCRAEHEVGKRWIVMAIRYDDEYRRVDGEWLFSRRRERHWYAADLLERPQQVGLRQLAHLLRGARAARPRARLGRLLARPRHDLRDRPPMTHRKAAHA